MANPAMDPTGSGVDTSDPQNAQILKQFAAAKANLGLQKQAAYDQTNQNVARNQAITGMSGGTALKTTSNAENQLDNTFAQNSAALDTNQANALASVAATKQAQGYGTSERLGSQEFTAGQTQAQIQAAKEAQSAQIGSTEKLQTQSEAAQKGLTEEQLATQKEMQGAQIGSTEKMTGQQLSQAQNQFMNTLGLQGAQFQAAQAQFNEQMNYQYNELNENQKTNLINATTAMAGTDIDNQAVLNTITSFVRQVSGAAQTTAQGHQTTVPTPNPIGVPAGTVSDGGWVHNADGTWTKTGGGGQL